MGKASRKKQSASQAGKPECGQAGKLTGPQANKQAGQRARKPTNEQVSKLVSRQAIHVLIILVVGFLAYSNTFHGPFQWDEMDYIVNNPIVKDLGFFAEPSRAAGLPAYDALKGRYIGYLTFALNYKLHGVNVFGYHIVNLVIHLINAILVYFLVLLTFRTPYFNGQRTAVSSKQEVGSRVVKSLSGNNSTTQLLNDVQVFHDSRFTIHYSRFIALAAALLFVAHPIQTEAVTYVFQRLASLVSMFYLMSLVMYIKGRLGAMGNGQWAKDKGAPIAYRLSPIAYYFLSLLSAILAMKTKENAFTLPVIITLYEFLFFSGPLKARVLRLVPFLLTMLIIPITIMGLKSTAGEIISQIKDPASLGYQELSRGEYLLTQMRVIITYIRLLFFPINQTIDYDYPIYRSLFALPVLLSFLFLLALFGTAVWLIYRSRQADKLASWQAGRLTRLVGFGILWFFITLSVESSIIPIPMIIDEYRSYLPSVGFFLAAIAGGLLFVQRLGGDAPKKENMTVAFFMVLALILAVATYARNTLWQDKVSLWEDVVAKSPNSPRGYNNLGIAYNEKGMNDKGIGMFKRCIELNPYQKDVHINLGVAYAMSDQVEKAIEEFTKAIAINPMNSATYANLARLYAQTDRFDKAAEAYAKAVELDPYNSNAYHGLGTSYIRLGRVDEALGAYTKFVSLSPNDPEAYRNRGVAYSQKGDLKSAREDFQKACSLGSSQGCESLEQIR